MKNKNCKSKMKTPNEEQKKCCYENPSEKQEKMNKERRKMAGC